jgi:hypothetical protein
MLTSFKIESIDIAKVYVRNTGQNSLISLSVYVNDEPAIYNVTTPIAAGSVGTITIYSFIPDGATIKVTSPNGFSASKVAQPCERAVGCWDFNEGSGNIAYDGSQNGNTGTISGAAWTSGKYGSALSFDGSDDYVDFGNNSILNITRNLSVAFWTYDIGTKVNGCPLCRGWGNSAQYSSWWFEAEDNVAGETWTWFAVINNTQCPATVSSNVIRTNGFM